MLRHDFDETNTTIHYGLLSSSDNNGVVKRVDESLMMKVRRPLTDKLSEHLTTLSISS